MRVDVKRHGKELTLNNDQVAWMLPASIDSIRSNNTGEATVSGSAKIRKSGPSGNKFEEYTETLSNCGLSFVIDSW